MEEPVVAWPLPRTQRELLVRLAELIRRFGAERFLDAHLVRADQKDFPEPWKPTLFAVATLVERLFWHVYLDPQVVVIDRRPRRAESYKMLSTSVIELGDAREGTATFHVEAIGNDDVAGMLSHRIGMAFLDLAPDDPFRTTRTEATELEGSLAAVYLGLGVLVANSSMYRRHASKMVAREVITEQYVERAGGLSIADATLLLAVQDILRDEVSGALATLHPPQAEWVERWTAVLDPHEDELRELLGVVERTPAALARADAPRVPAPIAEPDLKKFNHGQITFRVRRRKQGRIMLGMIAGIGGFALPHAMIAGPVLMLGCAVAGHKLAGFVFECADPHCSVVMPTEVEICPRCGGSIAETIKSPRDRLDRLEEIEAQRAGGRTERASDHESA